MIHNDVSGGLSPNSYSLRVSRFHELLSEHYEHNREGATEHGNILTRKLKHISFRKFLLLDYLQRVYSICHI